VVHALQTASWAVRKIAVAQTSRGDEFNLTHPRSTGGEELRNACEKPVVSARDGAA